MLLCHANVSFIDERLSKEEFAAIKDSFPGGQLPCYTDDQGRVFNQSQAILRALGI
jgi:glutathione S-transferase